MHIRFWRGSTSVTPGILVFTKKHQVFEPLPGAQVHSIALKLRAWPADTQRSAFQ